MLKLFHVPKTRSTRIIWLCKELGVPLDIQTVSFSPEFRMSPEWLTKNPVGKVPVLEDGELSMFESGAMVQYILDRYGNGRLQPMVGTPDHALCICSGHGLVRQLSLAPWVKSLITGATLIRKSQRSLKKW